MTTQIFSENHILYLLYILLLSILLFSGIYFSKQKDNQTSHQEMTISIKKGEVLP